MNSKLSNGQEKREVGRRQNSQPTTWVNSSIVAGKPNLCRGRKTKKGYLASSPVWPAKTHSYVHVVLGERCIHVIGPFCDKDVKLKNSGIVDRLQFQRFFSFLKLKLSIFIL